MELKVLPSINEPHNVEAATPAMIEAAINGALPRRTEFNCNALAIAEFNAVVAGVPNHGQPSN
jgi:hypothetical protein